MSSYVNNVNENSKDQSPGAPTLCPNYTKKEAGTIRCGNTGLQSQVIFMESIFTFAFVFTWLIVRNYELKGEFAKIQNLVKPIFVYLAYGWAVASQASNSSGICNPMVAIMVSIWERVSYNFIVDNTTKETSYSF